MRKKKIGRKGQMFVAAAVVIIVGLLLMKNLFSLYSTVEEKRHQESLLPGNRLDNIEKEYEYILGISAMQGGRGNGVEYLSNFSNYLRDDTNDFEGLYVFVVTNSSSHTYSITVGNFLRDKINATINVTDSTPTMVGAEIGDRLNHTWEFQSSAMQVNITLIYDFQNSRMIEQFSVNTGKNVTFGFFDIMLQSDLFLRKQFQYQLIR